MRKILKALDELRRGCAYLPNGTEEVDIAARALKAIKSDCMVKNWGR